MQKHFTPLRPMRQHSKQKTKHKTKRREKRYNFLQQKMLRHKQGAKAGRVCQKCGMTEKDNGRRLDVNHIIPFHQWANKSKANQQSNLEALCRSCHMITEWEWKKSNQVQMTLNLVR